MGCGSKRAATGLTCATFTIKLGKKPSLSAEAGGDRVKILNLDLANAKVGREGLAFRAARVKAALTESPQRRSTAPSVLRSSRAAW